MILDALYINTLEHFLNDPPIFGIHRKMKDNAQKYKLKISPKENQSWRLDDKHLQGLLANLPKDVIIALQVFDQNDVSFRIDMMLFGKGIKWQKNALIIELKEWSNEYVSLCEDPADSQEGYVVIPDHDKNNCLKKVEHPLKQALRYKAWLENNLPIKEKKINVDYYALLYNYHLRKDSILRHEQLGTFGQDLGHIYGCEPGETYFVDKIKKLLINGEGRSVWNLIKK